MNTKFIIYAILCVLGYILFKRDPLMLLFVVGAYLLYRFIAGNRGDSEKSYFSAMIQMSSVVSRSMTQIIANLDQLNANLERMGKIPSENFVTESDESDEFEHLA